MKNYKYCTSIRKLYGNCKAALKFGISRQCIIRWRKSEQQLKESKLNGNLSRATGAGRKPQCIKAERILVNEIRRRRDAGARVTGTFIRQEALRIFRSKGLANFKASNGWLRKFMARNNLSFRRGTHVAQRFDDENLDKMHDFWKQVLQMRKDFHYGMESIGNMDETPIYFDAPGVFLIFIIFSVKPNCKYNIFPGNYTIDYKGAKTINMFSTGHDKSRITVMLCAMANGRKLPPLVLFKGVRKPNPSEIPQGVVVEMSPQSWATEEIIQKWLNLVWGRSSQRRLLVWDAYAAHKTTNIRRLADKRHNSDLIIIPGGCTSRLQPCDVSWNRPFKEHFRQHYDEWVVSGVKDYTKGGNRRAPPKSLILQWVKCSWDEINPEIITKSFVVTGISSALDGSEDGMLIVDAPSESESDEDPFSEDSDEDNLPPPDSSSDEENVDVATATVKPRNWWETTIVVETDSEMSTYNTDDDYDDPKSPGQ